MKANYFLKVLAVMGFVFFAMNLSAKVITVKDQGSDSDIADALDQAVTGDTILIQGEIFFEAPVTIEKNVEFLGEGTDALFDGQGKTKLFEINPELIDGGVGLTFENLGFQNAYNNAGGDSADGSDGGIGRIIGGNVEFVNCWFDGNQSRNRGGAFYISGGANVRFAGCEASDNIGLVNGGFVFATGAATSVSYDYCQIKTNTALNSRGGAFYLDGGTHSFFYTDVEANIDGANNPDGSKASGEGGAGITTGTATVTMESSAVANNVSYGDHGAAFFLMGDPNITLINSIVAGNYTKRGAGSWFIANDGPGCDITFVNTIMANNFSDDNAGNAGAGIRVMNLANRINVFNSIIARNNCHNSDPSNAEYGAIDMGYNNLPGITSTLVCKNSIIGLIGGVPMDSVRPAIDNPNIPTKSLINMYRLSDADATQPDYINLDVSGVDFIDGLIYTKNFKMPYFTMTTGGYATKLGDPALLEAQDTKTDMLLVDRTTAADGSIFAGPVQSKVDGASFDDTGWGKNIVPVYYPYIAPDTTAIQSIAVAKQGISIIGTPSNGILGVDFGDLKGHAVGTLVSIAGQEVEKVFDLNVVSKGYYNINVAPGMYILKVDIEGKTYAQKLIVTK